MVLATEGTPNSGNKTEHFSYKDEWGNVQRCIYKKASFQPYSNNFSLKQLSTIKFKDICSDNHIVNYFYLLDKCIRISRENYSSTANLFTGLEAS